MSATQPEPVLIFLHLPKTGGRTLSQIIEHQYSSSRVLELYATSSGEELATLDGQQAECLRAIMGHFYFGAHLFLSRPTAYMTVLRDPVDRVISHYYFVRRDTSHYLHEAAQEMSLQEYVVACGAAEPNNDQTRLLAGTDQAIRLGKCTVGMLEVAKKNLSEHFVVVGLTEEFDRSLLLMQHTFGWRRPFYIKQNVTRRRPRREELSQETLRTIQAYNQLDLELYGYGKEVFQAQVCRFGTSIEREVRRFRFMNNLYNTVYAWMSPALGWLPRHRSA